MHYKVYKNGVEVYSGGTQRDCWKWLYDTYPPALEAWQVFGDGITIERARD